MSAIPLENIVWQLEDCEHYLDTLQRFGALKREVLAKVQEAEMCLRQAVEMQAQGKEGE